MLQIGKDKLWNAPRPEKADLSVQFISRLPRFPGLDPLYEKIDDERHGQGETGPVVLKNAEAPRWPAPGQEVTLTAMVRNAGARPVEGFDWCWLYDGKDVRWGRHEDVLEPDETATFELKRPWKEGRHFISFQVDREGLLDEISEENNWVIDRTDALSFAFFVEESVRDYFKTIRNGLGSYDWADWAQFQVRQMNKEFRDTIYPSCPGGIEERVRLDRVYVIPDGWGDKHGTHVPGVMTPVNLDEPELVNANDMPDGAAHFTNVNGGVDGVWGFIDDLIKPDSEKGGLNFYEFLPRWITGSEWPLHHELGHQLGRSDHYLIRAEADANKAIRGLGYSPP
ncbi:MAG: CARDB domain-containing protein, partial [Planctomycetota bacterium]